MRDKKRGGGVERSEKRDRDGGSERVRQNGTRIRGEDIFASISNFSGLATFA